MLFQHIINIKSMNENEILYILFFLVPSLLNPVYNLHFWHISIWLATFEVFSGLVWLVVSLLDGTGPEELAMINSLLWNL